MVAKIGAKITAKPREDTSAPRENTVPVPVPVRRRGAITDRELRALKPGPWLTDPAPRGAGVLQARRTGATVRFYYRYTTDTGTRERVALGLYDPDGVAGITLAQARALAGERSRQYQAGDRRLREAATREREARAREEQAQREAEQRTRDAAALRDAATLGALCTAYADYLEAAGKSSHKAARGALNRWVRNRWPTLWETPAADVTPPQVVDVLLPLVEAKKARTANMVRGYLRAAYALAVSARLRADAPASLRRLGLESNPVRDVLPVAGGNRARDRALTIAELRAYWHALSATAKDAAAAAAAGEPPPHVPPPQIAAALRLHLLTGAQRWQQLARATVADLDPDSRAVRLRDPKGRRAVARDHWVPLLPAAEAAITAMRQPAKGPYLLTFTGGESGADDSRARRELATIAAALVARGEVAAPFTLGDLRRTVETRLAEARVPADVRAHLQSHGLGGVQARHYDRYDRAPEVRAALETLHRILTGTGATVRPFRRRA